jgi:hypothetical protein
MNVIVSAAAALFLALYTMRRRARLRAEED